jgi:hypothetical protein
VFSGNLSAQYITPFGSGFLPIRVQASACDHCNLGTRTDGFNEHENRRLNHSVELIRAFARGSFLFRAHTSRWLSSKIVKNARLKAYKGGSHGICTTQKDEVNADLLAFIQG